MIVYPVLVAFRTARWMPIGVESYLAAFPEDRLLVVDNNPGTGELGWTPDCRRESEWLRAHPKLDVIRQGSSVAGSSTR